MNRKNPDALRYFQFGYENTPDTAVGSVTVVRSMTARFKPVHPVEALRQRGSRIDDGQVAVLGAMTTGALEGWLAANDFALLLPTHHKLPVISTPSGATTARDWTFLYTRHGEETPQSLTYEDSWSNIDNARVSNVICTGYRLDLNSKQKIALTGDLIGTLFAEESVTPTTSGLTIIPHIPMSIRGVDHFLTDVLANLAANPLTDVYGGKWEHTGRSAPVFAQRSSKPSYSDTVAIPDTCMMHLGMEKNSQSDSIMRQLRNSSRQYYRLLIAGPLIETGFNYEVEITIAFDVNNPDRGAIENVYGAMYDLVATDDATLGGFCKVRVRTSMAAVPSATNLASGQQTATLIAGLAVVGSV